MWVTEGIKTDPRAGQLLADTGQLPSTPVTITIIITADVSLTVNIRHRDATNLQDLHAHALKNIGYLFSLSIMLTMAQNERILISANDDVTGNVQASMIW